jgi:hypothetical protein
MRIILIAMARIRQLDLLHQVSGAVVLLSAVVYEIGIHGSPKAHAIRAGVGAIGEAQAAGWLTIAKKGVEGSCQQLNPGVYAG